MKRIICDIETDGLNPTTIYLICTRDVDNEKDTRIFRNPVPGSTEGYLFRGYLQNLGDFEIIGHNFISYDWRRVLQKFYPGLVPAQRILDTLVCSRLFRFDAEEGHSLAAWGSRLGINKVEIDDWSQGCTEEMVSRCLGDVEINYRLFKFFEKHISHPVFKEAIRLEHDIQLICEDMNNNGFGFNVERARELHSEITKRVSILDDEIQASFPPKISTEVFIPKVTRKDLGYVKGEPFYRHIEEPFNPGSPKQIVEKLNEAGWKPTSKTKGHIKVERELKACRFKKGSKERQEIEDRLDTFKELGWSVDEENLSTLPKGAPDGARKLAERITLASRMRTLNEWLEAFHEPSKAIHGTFLGIGSWTHRMAHQNPNEANIPGPPDVKDKNHPTPVEAIKLQYNIPMRALWVPRKGRRLIGVDADGIQLRIFGHLTEDKDFIQALVDGKKEDKTDAHSLNALKLEIGYEHRDRAKTFIYAFLLGAGREKVAEILECSLKDASHKTEMFIEGYPGLKKLREKDIPEILSKGYFVGIDGRYVPLPSKKDAHSGLVLSGLLQNGESTVMKRANIIWRTEARKQKIPFWQVNFVHDEWQTETIDDDDVANELQRIQCESIRLAGEYYNLKCPLLGSGSQGYSWAETH